MNNDKERLQRDKIEKEQEIQNLKQKLGGLSDKLSNIETQINNQNKKRQSSIISQNPNN